MQNEKDGIKLGQRPLAKMKAHMRDGEDSKRSHLHQNGSKAKNALVMIPPRRVE